jgi:glycosyltransferase involved in cell wall biosynthesis
MTKKEQTASPTIPQLGVSIAMCTYNGEAYLGQQLESIAAQELPPDELIVCDDVSTDRTVALLQDFAKNVPFEVKVVPNQTNLGYRKNFAQAVHLCTQEVIAFCDQDDIWYPQKLARIEQRMRRDPGIGGVFSNGDLIDSESRPLGRTLWESFRFDSEEQLRLSSGAAVEVLLRRNVVTGMAFAFRSSMKELLLTAPDSWIHDAWLAIQIAIRSRLFADPEPLVGYRIHVAQQVSVPTSTRGKVDWVRQHGLQSYLAEVHRRNLDEYMRTEEQFSDLLEFLEGEANPNFELIGKVDAKVSHAQLGTRVLNSDRVRRLAMLASCTKSYEEFSPNGLRALVRDLIV